MSDKAKPDPQQPAAIPMPNVTQSSKASAPVAPSPNPSPLRKSLVRSTITIVVVAILVGGPFLAERQGWIDTSPPAEATQQEYTCPMHQQIRQPGPGRCPICKMELVPLTDEVIINPAARRLANIQTVPVKRRQVTRTIETVGSIAIDESRMATIAVYVKGRIERLFADYTGVSVDKGDHLAVLYSPELYSAQVEYVQSRRSLQEMGAATLESIRNAQERLVENSRSKLQELGMTELQITELDESQQPQSRLTIFSPIGGTVTEKPVVEGKYVEAGEMIYRIANLSTVWLMLEMYPEDAASIRFGQHVDAVIQSIPGETFDGRVAFIDPVVDTRTRTVGVRVELLNDDGRLRPGDYASAKIHIPIGAAGETFDADLAGKWISPMHPQIISDTPGSCPICGMDLVPVSRFGFADQPVKQPEMLVVPRDAVLTAGNNSVAYVEVEAGRFEMRPLTLGPIVSEQVESENGLTVTETNAVVLNGLSEGDTVATSGNFLIDSEMQLSGRPSLIDPSKYQPTSTDSEGPVPLSPEHIHIQPLAGEAGRQLEQLYLAYFDMQASLASDRNVSAEQLQTLLTTGEQLLQIDGIDAQLQSAVEAILQQSQELRDDDIAITRSRFQLLSEQVLQLAFAFRGDEANAGFYHFFCPMAKPNGGDWLQPENRLLNPYFGSAMLECGSLIHALPTTGHVEGDSGD